MSVPFTSRLLQDADAGTPFEVLSPVLFNTFKHHAGALRARIAATAAAGPAALAELGTRAAVMGTKLMDLYTGRLTPREISSRIREELRTARRLAIDDYRAWLLGHEEYAVLTLPEDSSRWVLRLGNEEDRYIHLHPARWSSATVRVRANVLKTALLVLVHVRIFGGDPMDRAVINEVRKVQLNLSPLGQNPEGEVGLGVLIDLLRQE